MMGFVALVALAVLFKLLGHQSFTPLTVVLALLVLTARARLTAPGSRVRDALDTWLLQFGVLIYALSNQEPSYHEHVALLLCLVPAWPQLRRLPAAAWAEGSVLAVLAFVAWSLVWSANRAMSASGLAMSVLCAVFLAGFVRFHRGDLQQVLGQVLVVLAAVLVGSLAVGLMGHGAAGRTFSGVTLHRNQLGFLLGVMILLCLFVLRSGWRWPQALGLAAAAGLLVFIDSKSAMIAVTLTAWVFLVISARHWRRHMAVLIAALAVGVTALPSPKMDHFALWMGRDPTFTSRTEIWADSLRLAAQQPVTGYGYNAVWSAHENSLSQFPDAPGPRYAHAHNAWIDWVLQLGLGGWLVYLAFLAVLVRRAWAQGAVPARWQTLALLLYIQVYDLANVSTVPITRSGFFLLAAMSLCLWLSRHPWPAAGPGGAQRVHAPAAVAPPPRSRARVWTEGAGWAAGVLALVAAYAVWNDGRELSKTASPGAPAPQGVAEASYLDAGAFQWRTPEQLAAYARRHREALIEQIRRSEVAP